MNSLHRLNSARFSAQLAFAIAIGIFAATIPATAWAQPAQNVGTITKLDGSAAVQRGSATLPAAVNLPIQLHDRITTQPNSWLTIGMIDNSDLRLGAQAILTIDDSMVVNGTAAPSKVGLLGGSLHTLIAGAMRGSSPTFEVHTPNAVGAVRGTEFDTSYFEGVERKGYPTCKQFTDFTVEAGTVNVSSPTNNADRDVHQGESLTVACDRLGAYAHTIWPYVTLGVLGAGGGATGIAAGLGAFDGSTSSGPVTDSK